MDALETAVRNLPTEKLWELIGGKKPFGRVEQMNHFLETVGKVLHERGDISRAQYENAMVILSEDHVSISSPR